MIDLVARWRADETLYYDGRDSVCLSLLGRAGAHILAGKQDEAASARAARIDVLVARAAQEGRV